MPGRPKVLTVESELRAAFSLASAVSSEAWDVVSATDFSSAIRTARETKPGAIVLSGRVLGGGGVLVLKRLRSSAHTASVPVIGVAGTKFERESLREGGALECLAEPVDRAALRTAVEKHLASPPQVLQAPSDLLSNPERLAALHATSLVDSPADQMFDRVTRLASRLLNAPITLISLIDRDRQFFKSHIGMVNPWAASRQTPLSHSFCQWVVSDNEDLVVSDSREHPTLKSNLAVHDLGVIAYAGVPVSARGGQPIGSFCAIDSAPRQWADDELATLHDLRDIVDAYVALTSPAGSSDVTTSLRSGISGATRVLLRGGPRFEERDRRDLVGIIDNQSRHLIENSASPLPDHSMPSAPSSR